MDTKFTFSPALKISCFVLVAIGVITLGYGFFASPQQAWANVLLNNYFFICVSIGAAFFMALQYITQSGWSAQFKRVPEAMGFYLPAGAVIMLLLYFGLNSLYHWSHQEAIITDAMIRHKAPYLNPGFFMIRLAVFFLLWIGMNLILRRLSLREDVEGGLSFFHKSETYSKIYIFIIAITFTFATFDWIMSIDVHWYSTLFALKNFVTAFYHGVAVVVLVVILLHEKGAYPSLNKSHLLDFSRYLFMLSIVWGYFWFSQFMLIWYSNIPEETIYYARQWREGYLYIFYINVIINWFIPFILLLAKRMDQNIKVVKWVSVILIFGLWIDLYTQIIPGAVGSPKFGFIEIGSWLGFAGLFTLLTFMALSRTDLIPKHHPYLKESLQHHVE